MSSIYPLLYILHDSSIIHERDLPYAHLIYMFFMLYMSASTPGASKAVVQRDLPYAHLLCMIYMLV